MTKPGLLVISEYPPRGTVYGFGAGGMASFTKNTLKPIAEETEITVLANLGKEGACEYDEDGIKVKRCWQRNSLGLYLTLIRESFKYKCSHILLEFEFAAYGDFLVTGFMPFYIFLMRLTGHRVVIAVHQVVLNLSTLSGHLNFKEGSLKNAVFNTLLKVYYFALITVASKVVVFEELLRRRLWRYAPHNKVVVINHGVDPKIGVGDRVAARKAWGFSKDDFVLITFGYIAWYKGTDWLIKNTPPGAKLVVAGGPSLTQGDKTHYQKFYKHVQRLAHKNRRSVVITGFVPEEKIADYFAGADLVVLPYRTMMSASGPLATAFSMNKPVLLSKVLEPVLWNADAKASLKHCGLTDHDLVFSSWGGSLAQKVQALRSDPHKLSQLAEFSWHLGKTRNWKNISAEYFKVIFQKQ